MKALNAGDRRVELAFTLAFLKAIREEDSHSDSLREECECDGSTSGSVQNSTNAVTSVLLKLLTNDPPHTLPRHVTARV